MLQPRGPGSVGINSGKQRLLRVKVGRMLSPVPMAAAQAPPGVAVSFLQQ